MSSLRFSTRLLRSGKSNFRTSIYTPPGIDIQVSIDEFYEALKTQAALNELPAIIELEDVCWDEYNTPQKQIVIYHDKNELRPVQIVVGLENVGRYYYVEERVCYALPTELPPMPKERITSEPKNDSILTYVIVLGLSAILILTIFIPLIALIWVIQDYDKQTKLFPQKVEQWKLTKNFDQAIAGWINRIVEIDNRSRSDDELGRFVAALQSTVGQVVEQLFIEKHAQLKDRIEKELSQKELNQELERRRNEGFS